MFNYFVEIVANCIMYVLTGVNYFEGIGINDFDTIGMYQTVYYLFLSDMEQAIPSLVNTIGAAGAIATAIFIVDAFVVVLKKIFLYEHGTKP